MTFGPSEGELCAFCAKRTTDLVAIIGPGVADNGQVSATVPVCDDHLQLIKTKRILPTDDP